MNGAELIAAERERQVRAEGWTPEHDDQHIDGSLAQAAQEYIDVAEAQRASISDWKRLTSSWPWDSEWWKPSPDPVRNLVKAGALIAAEIDRLQRQKS